MTQSKDSQLFSSWTNQCFQTNQLSERFNDSRLITVTCMFLSESVFLNKSIEWTIQWLTHIHSYLFHSWMNQCVRTNRLSERFNDSRLITVTCMFLREPVFLNKSIEWTIQWLMPNWSHLYVPEQISVFKQIHWVNVSMTHSYLQLLVSFMNESLCSNKSVEWTNQWLIYIHSYLFHFWMNQYVQTNQLSERIKGSLIKTVTSKDLNKSLNESDEGSHESLAATYWNKRKSDNH